MDTHSRWMVVLSFLSLFLPGSYSCSRADEEERGCSSEFRELRTPNYRQPFDLSSSGLLKEEMANAAEQPRIRKNQRRRKIFADIDRSNSEEAREASEPPNYYVGLEDNSEWPTIDEGDDFLFSVVNPTSYTSIQEFCQSPLEYTDLSQGCNCSGEHVCLQLHRKELVTTTSNPFSSSNFLSARSDLDWCLQNNSEEVVGCSCEWRNVCDNVIYATPRMNIVCTTCPQIQISS